MKTIQEIAREYSMKYDEQFRHIAFESYIEGYREGQKNKNREDWDLSFCSPPFREIVYKWLCYKKERKEKYRSQGSMIEMYNRLCNLSDNNPEVAKEVVNQAMANNWAGLHPLKNEKRNSIKQGTTIFDFAERILRE